MPLFVIIILAVIAVGLVAAVVAPIIAGDPIEPRPEAPTEITAPADPGRVDEAFNENVDEFDDGAEAIYREYQPSPDANPDPRTLEYDEEIWDEAPVTEHGRAVTGAANSIPGSQ